MNRAAAGVATVLIGGSTTLWSLHLAALVSGLHTGAYPSRASTAVDGRRGAAPVGAPGTALRMTPFPPKEAEDG